MYIVSAVSALLLSAALVAAPLPGSQKEPEPRPVSYEVPFRPKLIPRKEAGFRLRENDVVLGVVVGGEARAYPIRFLGNFEIVNDEIGRRPIAVTWCPLTLSGVVFDRRAGGDELIFRFAPDLHNGNLVLRDAATASSWSQLEGKAIDGALRGTPLVALPVRQTTWGSWRRLHPDTLVMDSQGRMPVEFDYQTDREGRRQKLGYERKDPHGLHRFDLVLGIEAGGAAVAYPFSELRRLRALVTDVVGGSTIVVHYDKKSSSAHATDTNGAPVPAVTATWEGWKTFHSDTRVFRALRK